MRGNPDVEEAKADLKAVYPRECGGTDHMFIKSVHSWGLSPRVRGNLCGGRGNDDYIGSIPASAGEPPSGARYMFTCSVYPRECGGTRHANTNSCWTRVYPRECGGTIVCPRQITHGYGLSPRVRGNLTNSLMLQRP